MNNRQITTLNGRMWRELSRNPLRPAVLRALFKRLTKAQKQPDERSRVGGCHD
ncbi:hypothetical protein V1669_13255 [Aeromonas enteropelogenes]|uniref:hypothetical protein n=1 Tax=Aeromonas TaxID=642 RepID=UPI003136A9B9